MMPDFQAEVTATVTVDFEVFCGTCGAGLCASGKGGSMIGVFAFACRLRGSDNETIYNAKSANKAKYEFHRDILDPLPDVKYTDIRVRKLGGPHTSDQFVRNAVYRGIPDAKCGQRVRVGRNAGVIVGHNSSANFDVLFDDDSEYGARVLNVHPSDVVMLTHNAELTRGVEP